MLRHQNLLVLLLLIASAPQVCAAGPDAETQAWTRLSKPDASTSRLDIAVRLYQPTEGDGPTIALVGAIHIGDPGYYTALQGILDGHDLVLFEGVGGPKQEEQEQQEKEEAQEDDTPDLYQTLATQLGLAAQSEHIHTEQPGWINSDMRWDELRERFGDDNAVFNFLNGAAFGGGEQSKALLGMIERTFSRNPNMRIMLKRMMINLLGQKMPDIGALAGKDFERVIVEERNQVVIDDLKQALKEKPGLRSVALFYGAAHMPDMEKRLHDQLGYKHVAGFWLPAITLDPRREAEAIRAEEEAGEPAPANGH